MPCVPAAEPERSNICISFHMPGFFTCMCLNTSWWNCREAQQQEGRGHGLTGAAHRLNADTSVSARDTSSSMDDDKAMLEMLVRLELPSMHRTQTVMLDVCWRGLRSSQQDPEGKCAPECVAKHHESAPAGAYPAHIAIYVRCRHPLKLQLAVVGMLALAAVGLFLKIICIPDPYNVRMSRHSCMPQMKMFQFTRACSSPHTHDEHDNLHLALHRLQAVI